MRPIAAIGFLAGTALLTLLVAHFGLGAILHATEALGWGGFGVVLAYHLGLIALMGAAWWILGAGRADARPERFVWGRLIRESASEALPFSQLGGFILGARAATLAGVSGAFAAASMVVDVTVELIAQLGYTLFGLTLLAILKPGSDLLAPLLIGVCAMTALAVGFIAVQARGADLIERALSRLALSWLPLRRDRASAARQAIHDMHHCPLRLAAATFAHLGTWLLNGLEAWITLRLMGVHLPLTAVIVIDSLLYGIRSAAFFVPNALGVQEGAYVMLGGLFGLAPDASLALSLIRRGRDLVIGVPALLLWQIVEGRRAWRSGPALDDALAETPPAG